MLALVHPDAIFLCIIIVNQSTVIIFSYLCLWLLGSWKGGALSCCVLFTLRRGVTPSWLPILAFFCSSRKVHRNFAWEFCIYSFLKEGCVGFVKVYEGWLEDLSLMQSRVNILDEPLYLICRLARHLHMFNCVRLWVAADLVCVHSREIVANDRCCKNKMSQFTLSSLSLPQQVKASCSQWLHKY